MPPIWSIWACDSTTASMSAGLMPASAMLFCWRPVVAPNIFEVPMPVSNRISLSPVLTIGEFCSSTTFSADRKLSVSIFLTSSSGTPTKVPLGGPSGNVPSETTVTSASPRTRRCQYGVCVLSLGALANALPPSAVDAPRPAPSARRDRRESWVVIRSSTFQFFCCDGQQPHARRAHQHAAPEQAMWQDETDRRKLQGRIAAQGQPAESTISLRVWPRWYPRFSRRHPAR